MKNTSIIALLTTLVFLVSSCGQKTESLATPTVNLGQGSGSTFGDLNNAINDIKAAGCPAGLQDLDNDGLCDSIEADDKDLGPECAGTTDDCDNDNIPDTVEGSDQVPPAASPTR